MRIICVVAQEINKINRVHKLICPNGFQSVRIYLRHPNGKASLKISGDETSRSGHSDWETAYQILGIIKNSALEDK